MSKFTVEHDEHRTVLSFEPLFRTSSGLNWPKLGVAAMKKIKIEDWDWNSKNHTLYQYLYGELSVSDYANMVGAAQAEVTKIMGKLVDWDTCRQLLEEAK